MAIKYTGIMYVADLESELLALTGGDAGQFGYTKEYPDRLYAWKQGVGMSVISGSGGGNNGLLYKLVMMEW